MLDIIRKKYIPTRSLINTIVINFIAIFIITYITVNIYKIVTTDEIDRHIFNEDWQVSYHDEKYDNVNLDKFELEKINYNDKIIITRKIKKDDFKSFKIEKMALLIKQIKTKVKVWLDDKMIYENDNDKYYFLISLDKELSNKTLKIEYITTQANPFSKITSPTFLDEAYYDYYMIRINFFDLFMAGFYLIFSLIAVILAVCSFNKDIFTKRIIIIGSYMFFISVWLLSNTPTFHILLDKRTYRDLMNNYSLYVGVFLFCVTLHTFVKNKSYKALNRKMLIFINILGVAGIAVSIYNRAFLSLIENFVATFAVITIIIIMYELVKEFKDNTILDKYQIVSLFELGITFYIEDAIYTYKLFTSSEYTASYFVKIGLAIYVILLLIAYGKYIIEIIKNQFEKKYLTKQAYQDILTGLYNRIKVMETIEKMNNDKIKEYTIINFDLNNLKKINDLSGHLAGDKYLQIFSKIIKEYLKDQFNVIGRVGGDEFVAISQAPIKTDNLEKVLKKALTDLTKECKKNIGIDAKFAYGYVSSNKTKPINIADACKIADKMMYECKKNQKSHTSS